jgi:hypothetical protein
MSYSIKAYKETSRNPDGSWSADNVNHIDTLKAITSRKDLGLHIRLNDTQPCVVFGDIDYCENKETAEKIFSIIAQEFGVSASDISKTYSIKNTKHSYHWSIPSLYTDISTLKSIFNQSKYTDFNYTSETGKLNKVIDTNVYKNGWFRLPYQTLEDKKNKHIITNGVPADFLVHYINPACKAYIVNNPKDKIVIIKKPKKNKIILSNIDDPVITTFNLELMDEVFKIHYEAGNFNDFNNWRDVGWLGRHLNNTKEGFELFLKYSRKSPSYENVSKEEVYKAFYQDHKYVADFDEIGCLLLTRRLNRQKYNDIIDPKLRCVDKYKFNDFNNKYVYENIEIFKDFIYGDTSVMAVSSPYGTGKSYAYREMIDTGKFKRVLFLTYRVSLAESFKKTLQEKGFVSYQDLDNETLINSDRLIIQLDSLERLIPKRNKIHGYAPNPEVYDLVILDESEGILSHFNADTLKKKESILDVLIKICKESNKIFVCDGDLGNRTIDFIHFSINRPYKLYKNIYNNTKKHIIFTRNQKWFNEQMDNEYKAGKKIVIASMLETNAREYYEKLSTSVFIKCPNKFRFKSICYPCGYNKKVVIHTGRDKNKNILQNIKEEWAKADALIYTPTIESGVDFDYPHFDKCFGYMSNKSTSARAFSQMLSRVRQFEDNTTIININNLHYSEYDFLYYPDSLERHRLKNYDTTKDLGNIQKHNICESLNKEKYIVSDFINIIKRKGYTYEFQESKFKKDTPVEIKSIPTMIGELPFLSLSKYDDLIEKQNSHIDLTYEEKLHLEKYFMSIRFKIDPRLIDVDFAEKHYRKDYKIRFYKAMNRRDLPEKSLNDNQLREKVDIIRDVIKIFENGPVEQKALKSELKSKLISRTISQYFPSMNMKVDREILNNVSKNILDLIDKKIVVSHYKAPTINGKQVKHTYYKLEQCEIITQYLERVKELEVCYIEDEIDLLEETDYVDEVLDKKKIISEAFRKMFNIS